MSLRRELDEHRKSLAEIREIMNSMKTLAYMETRKLARFLDAQQTVVRSIETAAADLLSYYPHILPKAEQLEIAYLLVGSERGFCGDFNHALLKLLDTSETEHGKPQSYVVAIGRKLTSLLEDDSRLTVALDGASTVDEISNTLIRLTAELTELQKQSPGLTIYCLYHDSNDGVTVKLLLPPFQASLAKNSKLTTAPVVNVKPPLLFAELSEHYLFAVLHQILYTSLHAENHLRVTHMEGAVKHLDEQANRLQQRYNALRQEEITEEIEVILLNAANLEGRHTKAKRNAKNRA